MTYKQTRYEWEIGLFMTKNVGVLNASLIKGLIKITHISRQIQRWKSFFTYAMNAKVAERYRSVFF